jgi:hypothetical protein
MTMLKVVNLNCQNTRRHKCGCAHVGEEARCIPRSSDSSTWMSHQAELSDVTVLCGPGVVSLYLRENDTSTYVHQDTGAVQSKPPPFPFNRGARK